MEFPAVEGPVATEPIERVLRSLGRRIQRCDERRGGREVQALLWWRDVMIDLEIPVSGTIAVTNVEGFDDAVARCVADVLVAAPLPRPKHGVVQIRAVFEFRDRAW